LYVPGAGGEGRSGGAQEKQTARVEEGKRATGNPTCGSASRSRGETLGEKMEGKVFLEGEAGAVRKGMTRGSML